MPPVAVLLTIALLLFSPICTIGELYYVQAENSTTPCPGEPPICHTLSYYVQNTTKYFTSNTTFQFLSGHHYLNQTLQVTDVHNLTLTGNEQFVQGWLGLPVPSCQIYCNGSVGFIFDFMDKLVIANLLISGCGADVSIEHTLAPWLHAALALGGTDKGSIRDVNISTITIQNSTGYGILGVNIVGDSVVSNSTFMFNNRSCCCGSGNARFLYFACPVCNATTTLHIESSWFLHGSYTYLRDNCTLWYARATGLAITISGPSSSNLNIIVANIVTDGNQGHYGGNMNILYSVLSDNNNHIAIINSTFKNGLAYHSGGGLNIESVQPGLSPGVVEICGCTFESNNGTALTLNTGCSVTLWEDTTFWNNTGVNGGALLVSEGSIMIIHSETTLNFTNNYAELAGGAIWAPSYYVGIPICFFKPVLKNGTYIMNIRLNFENNSAKNAGMSIYGGAIDQCLIINHLPNNWLLADGLNIFNEIANINNTDNQTTAISSDPVGVCFCRDNIPQCHLKTDYILAFPGQDLSLPATTVGQMDGTVSGSVHATVSTNRASLGDFQDVQSVLTAQSCASLTYTIFADASMTVNLSLEAISAAFTGCLGFVKPVVVIDLQECPPGFSLTNDSGKYLCDCSSILSKHGISCNITNNTIHRIPPVWIAATTLQGRKSGFFFHRHCPFNYCIHRSISINISNPDEQCALNRSGVLCGACKPGLSLALGTSQCLKCSNRTLALLIAFAVAGLALVVLLFVCNLTVTEGTINGLIFYANIVWVNNSLLFPSAAPNILTVFLAWLNLDLGIQTCFYNGMDSYAKVWMQFLFPLYIWFLVAAIIYFSHRYLRVARLVGNNAVKVLATLFLLSFTKLLQTIIAALSTTSLLAYPNGSKKWLWLYDGNTEYLKGKLIPLFVAALLFVMLSFLYVLLLLFIQCIRKGNWRRLSCVANLLPLFDAYTAPYKFKFQFWTGFLLLTRSGLFFIFALNFSNQPGLNLMATAIVSFLVLLLSWSLGGVYKSKALQILESSFLLNLSVTSIATLYTLLQDGNQEAVIYTSVAIVLTEFIGIIIYHLLAFTSFGKIVVRVVLSRLQNLSSPKLTETSVFESSSVSHEEEHRPLVNAAHQYREPLFNYLTDSSSNH